MPKILIADDSIAVRKVAERLLTEAGMAVSLAANGTEALAFLGRECPDLVVSDVIMPDKSGYEVCSFVRTQPSLVDVPVLLISGIVNDEVTRQAEMCRADGVLKKPFQGTSLKDRVHDLLAKRRSKPEGMAVNGNHPVVAVERPVMPSKNAGPEDRPPSVSGADVAAMPQVPAAEPPQAVAEAAATPSRADVLSVRVAELERAVAEEQERVSQTTARLQQAEALTERVHDLEQVLAKERAEQQQREQSLQVTFEQERAAQQQREQALQTALEQEREERQQREQAMQASLDRERERNQELLLRIEELTSNLTETQRRAEEEVAAKGAEVATLSARIGEAESALVAERQAADARLTEAAEATSIAAARIGELEATLNAERDAAAQLVEQITGLERLEVRVQELDTRLSAEREKSAGLQHTVATLEQEAARAKELDAALIAERERSAQFESALSSERQQAAILVQQVRELDAAVNRARELDAVLAGERERSTQLAKRATEAEQLANQSNRRLEDMARKLAEIAGLASQLANSQR